MSYFSSIFSCPRSPTFYLVSLNILFQKDKSSVNTNSRIRMIITKLVPLKAFLLTHNFK